jgi:Na+/H+-translocating membrane pyrophosphatase
MGEWVAALCGLGLLAVMFADWYQPAAGPAVDAWESFSVVDVIVAVVALAAIVIAAVSLAGVSVSLPVAGSAVTSTLSVIAILFLAWRLIDPPGSGLDRDTGIWLGLLLSLGIFAGGYIGMGEEPVPD